MEKLTLNVKEAAKVIGVGLNTMYEIINRADFPAVRISERRVVIPVDKLREWLDAQAEILLQIVDGTGADYFHSETNDLYAAIPVAGHIEIWPLDGKDFAIWLHGLYYGEMGRPASNEAVGQAVSVLSARARFDRPEAITLHTRAAERDGAIWYDLTNPAWQVIKITPDGWRVHDSPLIMFNRYRHQAPQIMPQPGGDVKRILRYVNLKGQHTLFLCCLISYLVPGIPHAMLIFFGEKGAAKTTASSLLKTLIDPSALETLTLQNDPRTLAVNLQQHWFLPFDNVSHINEETSDTLCRAITGGGIQQRKLFTNADDTIFTFKRCLAINGINNVATRPDLLDRSLLVELERIAEHDRRELADIKAEFEADRPAILGGILDTLARAMAIFPTVKLDNLPRMADFARWGYAIGEALGGLGRQFLDEYAENRNSQNTEAINSDPVATLIVEFMSGRAEWDGTVSALYSELTSIAAAHNISTQRRAFPADPARLTKRINGIKSNLEAVGITFKKWHNRNGNYISLSMTDLPSQASHRHKPSDTNAFGRDASVTVRDGKTSSVTPSVTGKPLQILNCDASDGSDGKNSTLRGGVL